MKTSVTFPHWAQSALNRLPHRRRRLEAIGELKRNSPSLTESQDLLGRGIASDQPFLAGRPGGTESEGISQFLRKRLVPRGVKSLSPYSKFFRNNLGPLSGIHLASDSERDTFSFKYLQAAMSCDVVAYGSFAPGFLGLARALQIAGKSTIPYEYLDPFYALNNEVVPWTRFLEGKKVLVVHPFASSILQQFAKRSRISGVAAILPPFDLRVVSPPVTFAGKLPKNDWLSDLSGLTEKVLKEVFDVALVAAGGFGLPLCHAIQSAGGKAIHIGGVLQVFFGIVGRRWETDPLVRPYIDGSWVRPQLAEVPEAAHKVEQGAYW